MKFVPKKARDDVNVSKEHPLVEAGTLVVGLSAIMAGITIFLIFLIDVVLMFVSPQTEAELFADWMPEDFVSIAADDPRADAARQVLSRLEKHWPDAPYRFRVEVSDSDELNAMALPGGLIVVTRGVLDNVESENELAFVVGHELGHFQQRDHLRVLGRGAVLGILYSVLSSSSSAVGLGISVADVTALGFSRKQETAADEFGLELVYKEYSHVGESTRFFDRIMQEQDLSPYLVEYLSTHPATTGRIARLRQMAVEHYWPESGELTPLAWESVPALMP